MGQGSVVSHPSTSGDSRWPLSSVASLRVPVCVDARFTTQPSAGFDFPHCGLWVASPPSIPSTQIKRLVRSSLAQVQNPK